MKVFRILEEFHRFLWDFQDFVKNPEIVREFGILKIP